MAEKMREKLMIIFINFALSAVLIFSIYFLGIKNADANTNKAEMDKRFDEKVDKTVHQAYVKQNEKDHQDLKKASKEGLEELKEHINVRFEDFKEFMKELAKQ